MSKRNWFAALWLNDRIGRWSLAEIVGTFAVFAVLSYLALSWCVGAMVNSTLNQITGQ